MNEKFNNNRIFEEDKKSQQQALCSTLCAFCFVYFVSSLASNVSCGVFFMCYYGYPMRYCFVSVRFVSLILLMIWNKFKWSVESKYFIETNFAFVFVCSIFILECILLELISDTCDCREWNEWQANTQQNTYMPANIHIHEARKGPTTVMVRSRVWMSEWDRSGLSTQQNTTHNNIWTSTAPLLLLFFFCVAKKKSQHQHQQKNSTACVCT